jgi:hypothetical protein
MQNRERASGCPARPVPTAAGRSGGATTRPEANGNPREDAPLVLGEKHSFWCEVCHHESDATWKKDRETGEPVWQIGNAYTPRCPKGGDCLRAIADALLTTAPELKKEPLPHLDPWLSRSRRRKPIAPEAPPTQGTVAGWHSRLLASSEVRSWLTKERGLTRETIRQYELGYDGRAVTFPVYDASGALVNIKRRYWPKPWYRDRKGKPIWTCLGGRCCCLRANLTPCWLGSTDYPLSPPPAACSFPRGSCSTSVAGWLPSSTTSARKPSPSALPRS